MDQRSEKSSKRSGYRNRKGERRIHNYSLRLVKRARKAEFVNENQKDFTNILAILGVGNSSKQQW